MLYKKLKQWISEEDDSTARAALYYVVCHFLVRGMGFITTPIFSRILSKAEFGAFSSFMSWESLLFPILTFNLRESINKSKYDYPDHNDDFLTSIMLTAVISLCISYIVVVLNKRFFVGLFEMNLTLISMLFLYMLFMVAFDFQQIQYNIYRKHKLYVVYSLSYTILTPLASIALILIVPDKLNGRILGLLLPTIIIGSLIYYLAAKRGSRPNFKYLRYALTVSLPLMLSTMSAIILSTSDRIMISRFCGAEDVAMYSIPYTVSSIAAIIFTAMNQAWAPWMLDNLQKEDFQEIRSRAKQFSALYAFLIIGLMLISPEIVLILGGRQYAEAVYIMPPVILAMSCTFMDAFYYDTQYFYGETFSVSIGTAIAAAVNIVLNYIFIPKYGYAAASYTTLVGYAVMLGYHFCIVQFKMKKGHIFPTGVFGLICIALIVIQIGIVQIFEHFIIRYILVGIYVATAGIILWKNRIIIMGMFKKHE